MAEHPIPPNWVDFLFGFPVTRLGYLNLIRALIQNGGMTPALALGSVREANAMPLSLATELLQLMSHSLQDIMDGADSPQETTSDGRRRTSIVSMFHGGGKG